MKFLMRWLPRSLFSRMVLVLLVGLLLAQVASLAVYWQDRGELMQRAMGLRSVDRIADIVRLLDSTSPPERARIVRVLNSPPLRVALDYEPLTSAPENSAQHEDLAAAFKSVLTQRLDKNHTVIAYVVDVPAWRNRDRGGTPSFGRGPGDSMKGMGGFGPPDGMKGMGGFGPGGFGPGIGGRGPPGISFVAQVDLSDGTLVTFDARQPEERLRWSTRLLLSLSILLLAIIVLTLLAVRWATQPLQQLAAAAEELGENIDRPPLPEQGPAEVSRAARAFNGMQQKLSRFIRDRTRIFAAMSHDLKTPITRMRLRAELLDDAVIRDKFVHDLEEMDTMVRSTLDFMRGLESPEPPQDVDLRGLLSQLQDGPADGRLTVEGTAAPYRGKALALKRCMGNLVDNAIQYGDRATVTLADAPDRVEIRIRDHGTGISQAEMEKVFDPFYRVEASRNRSTGGTGLGLTIARSIAREHGGDITLENHPQGGLVAILTLQRKP